ncbi:MAG: alpha/beta fold hydrolase [Streptosporangiales bacterium]|nr:alpha/beta fold hydrolase [Streptosporangiales bacterium]
MNGKPGQPGAFVSDRAREKFLTAYDRAIALWPRPRDEFDVETDVATTHVIRHGPRDGEPVVLLSGAGFNASNWYGTAAALGTAGYQVFGVDTPGDPNRSVARAAITPPATMAAWLDQVLGTLGDRPAHLVGLSYGGWISLNQAVRAPRRVASVTALDPAGLTPLSERFWLWLMLNGLASLAPGFARKRLAVWMGSPFMAVPEMMAVMWAGIRSYRMEPKFPGMLTDDELGSIAVPVLLLTGSRSALIRPGQARDRARLLPRGEAVVIPGSHGGFDREDTLNGLITAFLSAHPAGRPV